MNVVRLPIRHEPHGGKMHVWRLGTGEGFEVIHESSSGESYGTLKHFGEHERDPAIAYALAAAPGYAPCSIGRIDQ
uniref:Uncharacterized protein n=1 Tax=viral metagenome TaxID=1070528 RepID=A0A6M3XVJ8_9ZZZZ